MSSHPTLDAYHCLIVPGWYGSGDDHWQSHWQHRLPHSSRTAVSSWCEPEFADWVGAIDKVVQYVESPVLIVAHSLGCITVAHWAHHSRVTDRIAGALLVAPADVERDSVSRELAGFAPIPRGPCHSQAYWWALPMILPPLPSAPPTSPKTGIAS